MPADAIPYARYSVDRVRELSEYVTMDQMSLEDRRECKIESALECLCARWETLGVIAGKLQDQTVCPFKLNRLIYQAEMVGYAGSEHCGHISRFTYRT